MRAAVIVAGTIAEIVGWWVVSRRGRDVWRVMPWVLGSMGIAAVLVAPVTWSGDDLAPARALAVGVSCGLGLYLGTRVFVWLASRWSPFRRDVVEKYREAGSVALATSMVLSLVVMVPSEELFWRGLVQGELAAAATAGVAAGATWFVYVAENVQSRSLPIVAAAIVGGALWGGLAWWSGGVLASLGSHILWTGLMLLLPPGAGRKVSRA
ncbi:MAG: CPBP family glutamic-type intramembrane protease [Actinomycetota bacterium]